jgi:ABC-type multidrug transport system fused ATPase/permease subunit
MPESPPNPSILSSLRVLLPLVPRKEKRRFGGLLLLSVLMAINELILAGLVALLAAVFGSPEAVLNKNPVLWLREGLGFDFGNDPRFLALAVLCAILLTVAVKNALAVVQQWHLTTFSESVSAATRLHIFRFYQRAPFLWLVRTGVADLNFGFVAATMLASALISALQIFTSGLMVVTLFTGLVVVSPIPSLMFLGFLGVGGTLTVKLIRKYLDRCSSAVYTADYANSKIAHMALHGLKEMRLYGREKPLFSAHAEQLEKSVRAKGRQQAVARLPVVSLEILGFCTLTAVMLFLVYVQNAGMARISGVMGFMAAAAWRGLPVTSRLMESLTQLRGFLPYLHKVVELIALERSLDAKLLPSFDAPLPTLPFAREVRLENVSFRYSETAVAALRDVSLSIKAGSLVGIVGLSGAGKSTLINILAGLVPPESGRILVDDTPLDKDNASAWLRRIGYVAQAPYILDATLAENVALSRWGEEIDRVRVVECCRMAALDFLDELEKGIDTILGDRGTRLSGGQAQRVAIARALYSEPDLIIFDEATSSLDMKNEKAIHDTILSLRGGVTMIIIAHRLSTVEGCDELVWLDKGYLRLAGRVEKVLPQYQATLWKNKTQEFLEEATA